MMKLITFKVRQDDHLLHALPTEPCCVLTWHINIEWTDFKGIKLFNRNKLKFLRFLRKRCNVNPARGPFHHRAPSKIFKRSVRGMLPYKTFRGRSALKRLRAFEGVPPRYQKVKKQVAPHAMRSICLAPGRKVCSFCVLEAVTVTDKHFFFSVLHCWAYFAWSWMEVPRCYWNTRKQEEVEGLSGIRKEGSFAGKCQALSGFSSSNDDKHSPTWVMKMIHLNMHYQLR